MKKPKMDRELAQQFAREVDQIIDLGLGQTLDAEKYIATDIFDLRKIAVTQNETIKTLFFQSDEASLQDKVQAITEAANMMFAADRHLDLSFDIPEVAQEADAVIVSAAFQPEFQGGLMSYLYEMHPND